MLINVKMLNGSTFPVEIAEESTILSLKRMLVDKCGWEPEDQKLIYLGRVLQNEQTCNAANLKDGIAIHLVHKPRPVEPISVEMDDPMGMGGHDEDDDFQEGQHPIIFEAPSVHGVQTVPVSTPVDPLQRLQTLSRVVERLDSSRVTPFETAYSQRDRADMHRIFESSFDDTSSSDISPMQSGSELEQEEGRSHRAQENRAGGNDEAGPAPLRLYRNVMVQALGLTERLLPYADILSQAARSQRGLTPNGVQSYQFAFNQLNLALHELSHLFHGLSDITVDFQTPPAERRLTISPRVQIERQALLSAAVTIPMAAVGVPNIANLIAQHLDQLGNGTTTTSQGFPGAFIAGIVNTGFSAMSQPNNMASSNQNVGNSPRSVGTSTTQNVRPRLNPTISYTNSTSAPVIAPSQNSSARQPQVPASQPQSMEQDHFRAVSQTIQDHVASFNAANAGNGSSPRDTNEQSDLTRILHCTSPLNRSYTSETPTLTPDSVSHFPTKYISPMEFASDLMSVATHPLARQLMECIHDDQTPTELQRGAEFALAKAIVRKLVYQNGFSVIYVTTYTEDGIHYVSVLRDLKMRLRDAIMNSIRELKSQCGQQLPRARRFGIMEVFHFIAPRLLQDLKCIFCEDTWQGKWYIRVLLDQVFPKDAGGIKLVFEEELMKYYQQVDAKLSKYYGKLKHSGNSSTPVAAYEPEDDDDM